GKSGALTGAASAGAADSNSILKVAPAICPRTWAMQSVQIFRYCTTSGSGTALAAAFMLFVSSSKVLPDSVRALVPPVLCLAARQRRRKPHGRRRAGSHDEAEQEAAPGEVVERGGLNAEGDGAAAEDVIDGGAQLQRRGAGGDGGEQ